MENMKLFFANLLEELRNESTTSTESISAPAINIVRKKNAMLKRALAVIFRWLFNLKRHLPSRPPAKYERSCKYDSLPV